MDGKATLYAIRQLKTFKQEKETEKMALLTFPQDTDTLQGLSLPLFTRAQHQPVKEALLQEVTHTLAH